MNTMQGECFFAARTCRPHARADADEHLDERMEPEMESEGTLARRRWRGASSVRGAGEPTISPRGCGRRASGTWSGAQEFDQLGDFPSPFAAGDVGRRSRVLRIRRACARAPCRS
jgi:hypothetical protein